MPEPTALYSSTSLSRPSPSANDPAPPAHSEAAGAGSRLRRPAALDRMCMPMATMAGRTVRRAAVVLAMFATPALIFAAPLPASASTSGRLCETYGSYCLGSDTLQLDAVVVEKPVSGGGRNLTAVLQSGTFEGFAQYKLRFNGDTSLCVVAGIYTDVFINYCSDAGTIWAKDGSRWINKANTISFGGGQDVYLAGLNTGNAYFLKHLGQTGYFYQFSWK
jgi:hypothetical protein